MSNGDLESDPADGHSPWWKPPVDSPSTETLQWAARPFGSSARVSDVRRLTGGLVSSVYLLSIEDAHSQSHEAVLRVVRKPDEERAASMVREEAQILQALAGAQLPAPLLIDSDPDGRLAGGLPALLMTRLPGEINLAPEEGQAWLEQMAQTLARIHGTRLEPLLPSRRSARSRHPQMGPWMKRTELWERAWEVMSAPPPSPSECLIHGDYQHFNQLWLNDVLTGVVDWGSAAMGNPDSDVGHCRLNLAVLFSADWAERFRFAYESHAGRRVEPWWDLAELMSYSPEWQEFIPLQVAGRVPVDTDGMTERVEELIGLTLARL